MEQDIEKEIEALISEIGFEPRFYVIDKCRIRVLAVREQDRYEFKGKWVEKENGEFQVFPASLNIQALSHWPSRFELSKEQRWLYYVDFMENYPKKTEEQCQLLYSHEDPYHY